MTKLWPKISVVTPSFNQGKYLRETIESVLSQSYPNIEYIIIDGGSTDDSVSIIKEYEDQIDYWESEKDRGQSHAINKGLNRATGDILCWLNSDDQFTPDALWSAAIAFTKYDADLIAGICEVYESDTIVHRHLTSCENGILPLYDLLDLDNGWNAGQFFYQPEVFFSKTLWVKAGAYVREDCYYSMDYELWCRYALHQAKLGVIGAPLVKFRAHDEQKTNHEQAFKAELIKVRDQFCKENNITWTGSKRQPVDWGNKLKVAFINDLGYQYGAGIAQMRIAGAFDLAMQQVSVFDLNSYSHEKNYNVLLSDIEKWSPNFIIFGNIHAIEKSSLSVIQQVEKQYKTFWLTHDFWLFTGRCAYSGSCTKYLTGCNETCDTAEEYPSLEGDKIADAWKNKVMFLKNSSNFSVLANSSWASNKVQNFLNIISPLVKNNKISLGVPANKFFKKDKCIARKKLFIDSNDFVIAVSVSSLSDKRKGGDILVDALKMLNLKNMSLILIGRNDVNLDIEGVNIVEQGYTSEVDDIVNALNAADLFVGPSREETFGQVFVEAALCGIPSIGFRNSGVQEAIQHDITGVLVDEESSNALAHAILSLFNDRERLKTLSITAPIYANSFHSLEASYHSFFQVLKREGLVEKLNLPHKLAFTKTSKLVDKATRGWNELPWQEKLKHKLKEFVIKLISFIPNEKRQRIVEYIPDHITKFLVRILYG